MSLSPYETQTLLDEYLLFHYGKAEDLMPWPNGPTEGLHFPERTVRELLEPSKLPSKPYRRALDLGCAVGRSSYELTPWAHEVIGIDFSHRFVSAANQLRDDGVLEYRIKEEGCRTRCCVAKRPDGYAHERIVFQQGDAHHLPESLGEFEIVHAANLLCRLAAPEKLLDRLESLVAPGGQLLLTTPCTWLEDYTPKEHWPNGDTFLWLQSKLEPHFEMDGKLDLPFVIREHARKFQYTIALGTRWIRKSA